MPLGTPIAPVRAVAAGPTPRAATGGGGTGGGGSSVPPGARTNSQGQWWDDGRQTWVTPSGQPATYPGQIPFTGTTAPSVAVPMPAPTLPSYTPSRFNNPAGHGSNIQSQYLQAAPTVNPYLAYLNATAGNNLANAQAQNALAQEQYAAQLAAIRASGSGGGPPPDWQLMKDKLLAALNNSKTDFSNTNSYIDTSRGNVNTAYTTAEQAARQAFANQFNNLTSDATGRGAILSRGYGLNLDNAGKERDTSITNSATQRDSALNSLLKQAADANLALTSANQNFNFGLRDIADAKKRYGAGKGAAAAAASAAQMQALAALHQAQYNNTQGAVTSNQQLMGQLIAAGYMRPPASMSKPRPPSRPVGYQRA